MFNNNTNDEERPAESVNTSIDEVRQATDEVKPSQTELMQTQPDEDYGQYDNPPPLEGEIITGEGRTITVGLGKKAREITVPHIAIIALERTLHGDDWTAVIELENRDGKTKEIREPYETLMDVKQMQRILVKAGYPPSDCYAELVVDLRADNPSKRKTLVGKPGWLDSGDYIGYAFQITRHHEEYAVKGNKTHGFAIRGTLEEWQQNVGKYAEGNHLLTFALCVALSGLTTKFFRERGGAIYHWCAATSVGKSTLTNYAASIWGAPGLVASWSDTANARGRRALISNDSCMYIDELGAGDARSFGTSIYRQTNGTERGRCNRNSDLRAQENYRFAAISNGEIGVAEQIEKGGEKTKGGQTVRMIGCDASIGEHGIHNVLHGFENGAKLSDHLKKQAALYHGAPSEAYALYIHKRRDFGELIADARDRRLEHLTATYQLQNRSDIKVAGEFAQVIATGELASTAGAGVLPLSPDAVYEAGAFVFGRWFAENADHCERQKILDYVVGYIGENILRFHDIENDSDKRASGTRLGFLERDRKAGHAIVDMFAKSFEDMCRPYGAKTIKRELKNAGWLISGKNEGGQRTRVDGKQVRMTRLHIPLDLLRPDPGTPEDKV